MIDLIEAKPLNIQDEINRISEPTVLLNKCFFGKNSALKIQLTKKVTETDCYIHLGSLEKEKWTWIKTKFNELELAQVINFVKNNNPEIKSISFFHKFNDNSQSIFINKVEKNPTEKGIIVKIKTISKFLSEAEITVMEIIFRRIIELKNFRDPKY